MNYSNEEFNKEYHKILEVSEKEYFNIGLRFKILRHCFYYGAIIYSLSLGLLITLETFFLINYYFRDYFVVVVSIVAGIGLLTSIAINILTKKKHNEMISYSLTKKIKNYSRFYIQYFLLITFLAIIVYTYFYFLINQNWKISLVHIGFYLLVVLLFWFSTNGLWFFFEFRKEYKERRKWQIQTEEDCEKLEKLLKRFPKLLLVLKYNFRSDAKVLFFHRGKFQQRTYDGHMELVSKTEIVDFTKYIMSNRCTINKTLREINKVTKRWRKKHKKYFRKGIFEAYYIGIGYRHLLTKEQIYI